MEKPFLAVNIVDLLPALPYFDKVTFIEGDEGHEGTGIELEWYVGDPDSCVAKGFSKLSLGEFHFYFAPDILNLSRKLIVMGVSFRHLGQ